MFLEKSVESKVTIKDIAVKAGVSLGTASKVLNGEKSVKESNRKAVEIAVESLNYNVNKLARSLAHRPIKLGILLPSEFEQYYSTMLDGIREAIDELSDYKVSAIYRSYLNYNDETAVYKWLEQFEQEDVSGIVIGPSYVGTHTNRIVQLRAKGIPVVVVVSDVKQVGRLASIRVDATASGKMAADISKLLIKGEESVAVIAGNRDITEHSRKILGFSERAKELGIHIAGIYEDFSEAEQAYRLTEDLLEKQRNLRLIYVATANSVSVCKCIHDHGKEHQVHVIATDIVSNLQPFILDGTVVATLDQHLRQQGKAAVKVLYRYLTEGILDKEETRIRPSLLLQSSMLEKLEHEES